MKWIQDLKEGEQIDSVYICKQKQSLLTKSNKPYYQVTLQDKTGTIDAKIWEPTDPAIEKFEVFDHIMIKGQVNSFMGSLQINVKKLRVAQPTEYHIEDYVPVSEKDNDQMFSELLSFIQSVGNQYLQRLLQKFFVEDEGFIKAFRVSSAAKNIHHSFVGGLLEHTLGVTRLCDVFTKLYPILKRDLLICAAIFHDIGKIKELSVFPENTYTDDGQLLGHIYIGTEMINHKASEIENFPHALLSQLLHCILAHHGKLEYGSPKVPALIEAIALFYADGIDAKLETFQETLDRAKETSGWLPYQRLFESGLRFTEIEEQIKEQIEE